MTRFLNLKVFNMKSNKHVPGKSRALSALRNQEANTAPPPVNCPQGLTEPLPPVAICGDCRQCVISETRILVPASAVWQGETLFWETSPSVFLDWQNNGEGNTTRISFLGISEETKAAISEKISEGVFTINFKQ